MTPLRTFFILGFLGLLCLRGEAQAASESERDIVLKSLKRAAIALPEDKRARAEAAIQQFEQGETEDPTAYGWQRAEPFLQQGGVDALIRQASISGGPLRYARADALLAAGMRLHEDDPEGARKLNAALLGFAVQADDFERPIYAHAAAELAMLRCDHILFGQAGALLPAPENLRYSFWQGRLEGSVTALLPRIEEETSSDDTRYIRQVIDGYRPIAAHGYCPSDRRQ